MVVKNMVYEPSQAISGNIKDDTPTTTITGNSLPEERLNNKNNNAYTYLSTIGDRETLHLGTLRTSHFNNRTVTP